MASGKKGYFRHSFNTRKDEKIVALITKHKKEAYFHFFALCEMCGAIAVNSGFPVNDEFVFHKRTVCSELMVTPQRLTHHLLAIKSSLLGDYVATGDTVKIKIFNLRKYLGWYHKENSSNAPNKTKENKTKPNEIKLKPDEVIQLFNETLARKVGRIEFCYGLTSNEVEQFITTASFPELSTLDGWKELFEKIKLSKFHIGAEPGKDFVVTLNWLVNPDKARKLMSGPSQASAPSTKPDITVDPENPTGCPYTAEHLARTRGARNGR